MKPHKTTHCCTFLAQNRQNRGAFKSKQMIFFPPL